MSQEYTMSKQKNDSAVLIASSDIPYSVLADELTEVKKADFYRELRHISELYKIYKKGVEVKTDNGLVDYVPSDLRYKKAASILNKEARFLFANPPTFNININDVDDSEKEQNTILQEFLDNVLEKNEFNNKLLKAAKDCFIGKRVALILNFNDTNGITITFLNSMEFICERSGTGNNELTKIVTFYNLNDTSDKLDQRWFKKTYYMNNGYAYVNEAIYDGLGKEIEIVIDNRKTNFKYIPAIVILNDGLSGEHTGESELEDLKSYEKYYSKLANSDMDAERKSMNPTKYTVDASANSTSSLSSSPGAYWDIQSDEDKSEVMAAKVGLLEPSMSYSTALKTTLDRIEDAMYSDVDVPNINSEQLKGVITSGKTLKALYWGLMVRCDEKMLAWSPALEFMANAIIEGARLYPRSIKKYTQVSSLPLIDVSILVENNYPLPEDEAEEKALDLSEISAQVMSRKSYLKKWRKLTDKEADKEIEQIKYEQDLFENSVLPPYDTNTEEEVI